MKKLICFFTYWSIVFFGLRIFLLEIGVMSANLRLEGKFLELVKDLFICDVKVSAEDSDGILKIFDETVLKGSAFLLFI